MSVLGEQERRNHLAAYPGDAAASDAFGRNALHQAAQRGLASRCRALIAQGMSPEDCDKAGMSPVDLARLSGHHALAAELTELSSRPAVARRTEVSADQKLQARDVVFLLRGDVAGVDQLIATGRVGAIDAKGDTALHICAAKGWLKLCDRLIRAGADAGQENFDGLRPDQRAQENGYLEVATLLAALNRAAQLARSPVAVKPDAAAETVAGDAGVSDAPVNPAPGSADAETDLDDEFEAGDFDFEFEATEDAESFHAGLELEEHSAGFQGFEGRVSHLTGEDVGEDDADWSGLRAEAEIEGEGLRQGEPVAGDAPEARIENFLDVRRGRRSRRKASAPTTAFFDIDPEEAGGWLDERLEAGLCTREEISDLVSLCRGSYDAGMLEANLANELGAVGLLADDDERDLTGRAALSVDRDALLDLIVSLCSRSNMRPGMNRRVLTRGVEAGMVSRMRRNMSSICRIMAENLPLLDVVLMLAGHVEAGRIETRQICDLDIQPGQVTEDGEAFASSLGYLQAWREMLDDGFADEDGAMGAQEAIAALRLTPAILEVVVEGISEAPHLREAYDAISELLKEYARTREELLLALLPSVWRFAARRAGEELEADDLFQDGFFGLERSLDTYDPDQGVRLVTYAQYRIRQSIGRALDDTGSCIRLPVHVAERIRACVRAARYLPLNLTEEERVTLISEVTKIDVEMVRSLFLFPLEAIDFDELDVTELGVSEEPVWTSLFEDERREVLDQYLDMLNDREKDVLLRRFGLDGQDEMTLEQVGEIYGVTRERIRQVEANALKKLFHPAHARVLRGLL